MPKTRNENRDAKSTNVMRVKVYSLAGGVLDSSISEVGAAFCVPMIIESHRMVAIKDDDGEPREIKAVTVCKLRRLEQAVANVYDATYVEVR